MDSPSWHLVQALDTLIEKDGHTPAVEGFFDKAQPLSAAQKKMIEEYLAKTSEATSPPAGHFGMGNGTGAHAPDEYCVIESTNQKLRGLDGAVA